MFNSIKYAAYTFAVAGAVYAIQLIGPLEATLASGGTITGF